MEKLGEKSNKQENSLTAMLRIIIKQKDEIAQRYKQENRQLQELLFKQQNLLNKLNEDNMKLNQNYNKLRNSYSRISCQSEENRIALLDRSFASNSTITEAIIDELAEQNCSLKEQLLVSQNYGAHMLKKLKEAKKKIKFMLI